MEKIFAPSSDGEALGCSWPSSKFSCVVVNSVFVGVFAAICPLTEGARATVSLPVRFWHLGGVV